MANDIRYEVIEEGDVRFAEVIRAGSAAERSTFLSPAESSLQFGILAHPAGAVEEPHTHRSIPRTIRDLQQMFVVQKGKVEMTFFRSDGTPFRSVVLAQGDAILLVDGPHAMRILEDAQCISVKQGPFLGAENDKVPLGQR